MSRKDDHVTIANKFYQKQTNDFDKVRFIHQNFSEVDVDEVDVKSNVESLNFEVPFFINAMTGGSQWTKTINEKLALVAKETNLVMATGSMSAAFKDASTLDSYQIIKQVNPKGVRIANLQASSSVDQVKQAIEWLDASAIQLHVNVAQEIIMHEGDRHFKGWLDNIANVVSAIDLPIIVKEVGFGFSKQAIASLQSIGVQNIDISGKGGTNFSMIENARNEHLMDYMNDWGQSTVCSLLEASSFNDLNIIASGGVRNMLDVTKALALNAKVVGMSGSILHLVGSLGVDQTIEVIQSYKQQLKRIMALLNASNVLDLRKTDLVFDEMIVSYAKQRNIDLTNYHFRTRK